MSFKASFIRKVNKMKFDINKFLEKGNNKLIAKIIDAVVIAAISIFSLYYLALILSTPTNSEYLTTVGALIVKFLIFALIDVILILFTKPLFGFTSIFDSIAAYRTLKAREKANKKEIEETAKATLAAARAARKAEEARKKEEASK